MPIPERLERVTIASSRGLVVIPWDSCDQLLEQIRHFDYSAPPVIRAFEGAGASSPVRLDCDGVALLVQAIDNWMRDGGGVTNTCSGDLRPAQGALRRPE